MPRAAYIIASRSGAIDLYKNTLSMFEVIETYNVTSTLQNTDEASAPVVQPIRVVAAWQREDNDDINTQFKGQIVCISPSGSKLWSGESEVFSFSSHYHRWSAEFAVPGFMELGSHTIEARLRKVEEETWRWRQRFSFIVYSQDSEREKRNSREDAISEQGEHDTEESADEKSYPAGHE